MPNHQKQYQIAREAMIDSQIHPMGVVSEPLLDAFQAVPREIFVGEAQKGFCYCDEDIDVGKGRFLMEPSVLARLIQEAKPQAHHVALVIGSGVGYSAAILSHLVSTVVAVEGDKEFLDKSQKNWDALECSNIASFVTDVKAGAPDHAPYDLIIFNGAVSEIPQNIKNQLAMNGRLLALVKTVGQPIAKATLVERIDEDSFSDRVLFDAGTPYLVEFQPAKEFVF